MIERMSCTRAGRQVHNWTIAAFRKNAQRPGPHHWARLRGTVLRAGNCFALLTALPKGDAPGRSRARAATAPVSPAISPSGGEVVLEVSRTPRTERRLRGKDDALDAARTARAALASDTLALPRTGERREALRLLLVARRSAVDVRREALTQLRAVIVTAPERLRHELRDLPVGKLLDRCSRLRRSSAAADELATRPVLRSLAHRMQAATVEAGELERELLGHVRVLAPALLDGPGIGPIVAAQLIVAWSHHGRLRSEACFARPAGVAPVPASSGQTQRHRLSRGGDRQLNRALHTIALHRRQHDPHTRDYIAQRVAEGKTHRDATRLLKRYLAHNLYRLLQQQPAMT